MNVKNETRKGFYRKIKISTEVISAVSFLAGSVLLLINLLFHLSCFSLLLLFSSLVLFLNMFIENHSVQKHYSFAFLFSVIILCSYPVSFHQFQFFYEFRCRIRYLCNYFDFIVTTIIL